MNRCLTIAVTLTAGAAAFVLSYTFWPNPPGDVATYVGIGWLLANWWPHTNLHRVTGFNWYGLIWIEYGFHVTLIVAGSVLAVAFARDLRSRSSTAPRPAATGR